ncbi:FliM/FliN family flagellar motor switch protein [Roseibacterium sp. SDUM158017]|uniref:FliM/FliN family flagellar motor switch protein n=1 Tax=Roseicyclus salinarum TaxID=3036773 RepID=UPI0024150B96|nr:FliM/FliN family flagellar motor switch protein [Roseibacterium sp. SDUM158017]MDG4648636.1 FliM/FliN family flagellar motor switch protein [Roseibacterium sp. SDUM158017]
MADDAGSKTVKGRSGAQPPAEPPPAGAGDGPAASAGALFEEIAADPETVAGGDQRTSRGIEAMMDVRMDVQIVLGHARMPIAELLRLGRGSVLQLDRQIGEPVEVVVNDMLVARGTLVKLAGDRIGVTLTELMRGSMAEV